MIARLNKIVEAVTATKSYTVKDFESAKIEINIRSITGSRTIGFYGSNSTAAPTLQDRAYAVMDGDLITSNIVLDKVGTYTIYIDISSLWRLNLNVSDSSNFTFDGVMTFSTSNLKFDVLLNEFTNAGQLKGGSTLKIDTRDKKQVDIIIKCDTPIVSGNITLKGNSTFNKAVNMAYIDTKNSKQSSNGTLAVPANAAFEMHLFTNVEDFDNIELALLITNTVKLTVTYCVHCDYRDGREIDFTLFTANRNVKVFRGYKYLKTITTADVSIGMRHYINGYDKDTVLISASDRKMLKNNFTRLNSDFYTAAYMDFSGSVKSQGMIFYFPDGIYSIEIMNTALGGSVNTISERKVIFYSEKPHIEQLSTFVETNDFVIRNLKSTVKTKDVYRDFVMERFSSLNILNLYMFGYEGVRFDIDVTPFLNAGEYITLYYLLPYNTTEQDIPRICVFTSTGRILYNYVEETATNGMKIGMFNFAESTVYNPLKKWLPTNDKAKATGVFKYFPVLAQYDYAQFDGKAITAVTMPVETKITGTKRYHALVRSSSMARDEKVCVFGNYNTAPGQEPIVMRTIDGGKTWYVNNYFACVDGYNYMHGGNIDLTPISNVAAFVSGSLRMCRKRFNVATNEIKEPATPFVINENEKSLITGFSVSGGKTIVTVADNIDLDGYYNAVYFENVSANAEWDYICNTGFTADGLTNNGIFFRADKIAPNKYELYADLGDPYQSDQLCRHIHAVNQITNGFIVSTGESYRDDNPTNPTSGYGGGFLYMLLQNLRNSGSSIYATVPMDTLRLTSAKQGVNRACGAYMDSNGIITYASDEASWNTSKRVFSIEGRTKGVDLAPHGIFRGHVSDIDDQSKFECVAEYPLALTSFIESQGRFAASNGSKAVFVSKNGINWHWLTDINANIEGFDKEGNCYVGDKVVIFK